MSDAADHPPYHRPNLAWECGRACQGRHCLAGPSSGGRCSQSDSPCRPRLSLRVRRGLFVAACTLLTVGGLLVASGGAWRNEFFAPGPLSGAHAQILNHETRSNRCAECHPAGAGSPIDWLAGMWSCGKKCETTQTELCLKCHLQKFSPGLALTPHNRPLAELAERTARGERRAALAQRDSPATTPLLSLVGLKETRTELACSTCHKEHHGARFDLKAMTDRQCQTCHQGKFHSFVDGHPEFSIGRERPSTRIAFDHASHAGKHFAQNKQEFRCSTCHQDDSTGRHKLLTDYRKACGSCHDRGLETAGATGWAMFSVPTAPHDRLIAAGLAPPDWPEAARGDFDGRLSPILVLLLSDDPATATAIKTLGVPYDLARLDADRPEQLAVGGQIVLGLHRLYADLIDRGEPAVVDRLERLLGKTLDASRRQRLLGAAPIALVRQAARQWFAASTLPASAPTKAPTPVTLRGSSTNSFAASIGSAARFHGVPVHLARFVRPQETLIENPLSRRRNAAAKEPAPMAPQSLDPPSAEPSPPAEQPSTTNLPASNEPLPTEPPPAAAVSPTNGPPKSASPAAPGDDRTDPEVPAKIVATEVMAFAIDSAWSRDDATLTIRYQPQGHADDRLTAWLELFAQFEPDSAAAVIASSATRHEPMTTSCLRCHDVERSERSLTVAWNATNPESVGRGFTKFSHKPHASQPQLQDCVACHRIDERPSGEVSSGEVRHHDFLPIVKSTCAACHNAQGAGQGCTQCHHYHVHDL